MLFMEGYNLPAKYCIHAVGPVYSETSKDNESKLESAYKSTLKFIGEHNIKSVALCGLSTGIFGYPLVEASIIAVKTVREWLEANKEKDCVIIFCTFLPEELFTYQTLLQKYFPLE